jgi:ketosteroid isomerase-like protein
MSADTRARSLSRLVRRWTMSRRGALWLTLATVAGCASAAHSSQMATSSSSEVRAVEVRAVESALRSWYDASVRHDSAAYAALLLPEFFILEDTTRYDRATLLRLVAGGFSAGIDRATLSDFNTTVVGDAAWTTFRNEEYFTPNGAAALPVRRFLETAVFRRVDGQWKLERYHATRINRPPPKA